MVSEQKYRLPALILSVLLAVCTAGCGNRNNTAAHAGSCFIYTDGLLDDLCAIEYLAEKYDHAVILLENPGGLADNQYASGQVKDESALFAAASQWFADTVPYSVTADISDADIYLLAPLTEFADILHDDPSLTSRHAVLMAGDEDGPDGAGKEWNAAADIDAYRYVTENMTDLIQMTRYECESEYEKNGYPFHAQFLDEYTASMTLMNENLCCYDLQAAAFAFR